MTIELVKVRGEDNPADLFTKHVQSRERIHDVLALFGCGYADGRAAFAPQLRAGAGTGNGELLALKGAAAVDWHRQLFLAVEHEAMLLPEACESKPDFLSHMYGDQEACYPRAVVEHESGDVEPEQNTVLEQRGVARGATCTKASGASPCSIPGRRTSGRTSQISVYNYRTIHGLQRMIKKTKLEKCRNFKELRFLCILYRCIVTLAHFRVPPSLAFGPRRNV